MCRRLGDREGVAVLLRLLSPVLAESGVAAQDLEAMSSEELFCVLSVLIDDAVEVSELSTDLEYRSRWRLISGIYEAALQALNFCVGHRCNKKEEKHV